MLLWFFPHLGFWSGNLFLIASFPDLCLLVLFALIRQFIKNELDFDADKMYLARAHRLGPVKKFVGLRKWPLIVNFRDYCDIQSIMANAHLLRGTPFSVDYDHPKEIGAARKLLWDEIKSIKRLKPSAKCQIVYPAKLLVSSTG